MPLILISFIIFSCKKDYTSVLNENIITQEQYDRFFNLPKNANPSLLKIVNKLKQREKQIPFLKTLISECGMPKWEFSEIQLPNYQILDVIKSNSIGLLEKPSQSGYGKDSIILIPFVRDTNNYVNSFFAIKMGDSIQIELVKGKDYLRYGLDLNSKMYFAQQVAFRCMTFDNKIFKTDSFHIINQNLSLSFPRTKGKPVFKIEYKSSNDSISSEMSKLAIDQEKCQTVKISYIDCWWLENGMTCGGMPKGQCDECWRCVSYYEYTNCSTDLGFMFTDGLNSNNSGFNFSSPGAGSGGNDQLGWEAYPKEKARVRGLTDSDLEILEQIRREDEEADAAYLNNPCGETLKYGNLAWKGPLEHVMIQIDYIYQNQMYGQREYKIPFSGYGGQKPGYADIANTLTNEIFEIKPDDQTRIVEGRSEVENYVTKANLFCPILNASISPIWRKGIVYQPRYLNYPKNPTLSIETELSEPGVIVYRYKSRNPLTQPIVIPQDIADKLKRFLQEAAKNLIYLTPEKLMSFLKENPDVVIYLKTAAVGAGVAIIVGTIVEDFLTAGVGISDDTQCFLLGYKLIRIAWAL